MNHDENSARSSIFRLYNVSDKGESVMGFNPHNLCDVAFDVFRALNNLLSVLLAVAGMGGNFLFPEVFLTFSAVIPHDSVEVHIHAAGKRKKEE